MTVLNESLGFKSYIEGSRTFDDKVSSQKGNSPNQILKSIKNPQVM